KRMPVRQVLVFRNQTIGAGDGEPSQRANGRRRQLDTVRNPAGAARIVAASTSLGVEQGAADIGEMNGAGVLVLQLDEAAAGAAVAQALPLRLRHLVERLGFPERRGFGALGRHSLD